MLWSCGIDLCSGRVVWFDSAQTKTSAGATAASVCSLCSAGSYSALGAVIMQCNAH